MLIPDIDILFSNEPIMTTGGQGQVIHFACKNINPPLIKVLLHRTESNEEYMMLMMIPDWSLYKFTHLCGK